jgi:Rrf2 family transcriptional regulator, iron-sulfur cluster assembly transcription factor
MKLSTKTRYGVRAVFDIAYHHAREPGQAVQAKDIARREEIPLRYLEQIFQDLKRAGLVEARRGPRGGYYLKRAPGEIRLGDLIRALQGPLDELFSVEGEPAGRGRAPTARSVTADLWQELARHVTAWFDGVTVSDLVKRGEDLGVPRQGQGQPMYFI